MFHSVARLDNAEKPRRLDEDDKEDQRVDEFIVNQSGNKALFAQASMPYLTLSSI